MGSDLASAASVTRTLAQYPISALAGRAQRGIKHGLSVRPAHSWQGVLLTPLFF